MSLSTIAEALEDKAMDRARGGLRALLKLVPETATVLRDGDPVEMPAHMVRLGETVLVRAGQRIPVDGEVTEGTAAVSEAAITGEPMPAEKAPGSTSSWGLAWIAAICRTSCKRAKPVRKLLKSIVRIFQKHSLRN